MAKKTTHNMLWAGSEESFEDYLQANDNIQVAFQSGMAHPVSSGLLSVEGDIGIVSIKGALTNNRTPFDEMFGVTSYGAIQEAMIEALADPDIKDIVLDIDSGGGAVRGVEDTANVIAQVSAFKPVYAYTGGAMASGAYWLGSSANSIFASKTAEVGSIGVIMTHFEQSRRLETEGVKATVIRSGRYKQIGNPYEVLTDEGKAELQSKVDGVNRIFVEHVADARGKSYDYTETQMGQGRVFLAETAAETGLVDGIMSFENLLLEISTKTVDKNKKSFENKHIGANMHKNNKKTVLSAAVQAALVASGQVPAEEAGQQFETDPTEAAIAAAAAAAAAEAAPVEAPEGDPAATAATEGAPVIDDNEAKVVHAAAFEAQALEVSDLKAEVRVLKSQLAEQGTALFNAQASASTAQTKITDMEATTKQLASIVAKSANAMSIALGASARDYAELSATEVLTIHNQVAGDFQSKFKAGGVAVSTAQDTRQNVGSTSVMDMARIKATLL